MRTRPTLITAMTFVLLAGACGGGTDSTQSATTSAPVTTTVLATTPPTAPPSTAAPTTTVAAASGIGVTIVEFVDPSRVTDAIEGRTEAADERRLVTTVRYPAEGEGEGAAPIADSLPLIVLSHGLNGTPDYLADVADAVVEAGYVVALPLSPEAYGSALDVVERPADVSFVIDGMLELNATDGEFLAGTIDPERIGVAGHSLGAIATAGLVFNDCCIDESIDAAVMLAGLATPFDDSPFSWPDTPLLLVHGDQDDTVAYNGSVDVTAVATGPTYFLTLLDGGHGAGIWNDDSHHELMTDTLVAFFDRHVAGADTNTLDELTSVDGLSTWETFNLG